MAAGQDVRPEVIGFAHPVIRLRQYLRRPIGGRHALHFYERVLTFAHQYNRPVAVILAYAIAHEFGHVLLPAPAHTSAGLMKADWSDDDIRHLATDERFFTLDQVALMSAAIDGRRGVTR